MLKPDVDTRGAAMALTAAAVGFLACLLSMQVVQGQNVWRVVFALNNMCALKGSTVHMHCTYSHPPSHTMREAFWFTGAKTPLKDRPAYRDRVEYFCVDKNCTLIITDLRESDKAQYGFRFLTYGNAFTGLPGITLSVTDIHMQVNKVTSYQSYTEATLTCQSSDNPPYVWFKNGQEVSGESSSYTGHFDPGDSISCALKKDKDCHASPLYAPKVPPVSVSPSGEIMEGSLVNLTCSRDANIAANYSWYKNPENVSLSQDLQLVLSSIQSSDSGEYYCTAENELGGIESHYISLNVKYGPRLPSVSVSPSAEIVEGSSVNLTCSSDANPAASYTWYKENQTLPQGHGGIFHFPSISSEDRGNYYCESENQYGQINSTSLFLDVKYAPKLPSVSVSPSEIVEGSSVNLTCSSDANPAANYTWYKENQTLPQGHGGSYRFPSISSEDRGNYYCLSKNKYGHISSSPEFIDVQYAPRRPSVSVCPSAEIVEGSSVTLFCSSDANPAAKYTWYKENEDSPKASGQIFIMTDYRAEHSGNYHCEAQNSRGRHRSTLHLTVGNGEWPFIVAGTVTAIVIVGILISVFLWIRKKRASEKTSESTESPEKNEQKPPAERLHYASVHFSQKQADPLYTNSSSALDRTKEKVESVEYATVIFNSASTG